MTYPDIPLVKPVCIPPPLCASVRVAYRLPVLCVLYSQTVGRSAEQCLSSSSSSPPSSCSVPSPWSPPAAPVVSGSAPTAPASSERRWVVRLLGLSVCLFSLLSVLLVDIDLPQVCDGRPDCGDLSDEGELCQPRSGTVCPHFLFSCHNQQECVSQVQ